MATPDGANAGAGQPDPQQAPAANGVNAAPAPLVVEPGAGGTVLERDGAPSTPAAGGAQSLESLGAQIFYEKPLTSSDANGSGRVVIPKAIAEQYFPHLDNQAGVPIDATDTQGNSYTFRFRFWINNQSRMYLLEGVSEMHQRYDLKVGDVMIFAHLPDNNLIVAGRPMTEADMVRKPPLRRVNGPQSGAKREPQRRLPKPATNLVQTKRTPKARSQGGQPLPMGADGLPNGFQPPTDGVFRAIPSGVPQPSSSVFSQHGVWTATIEIVGEMYQAYFDSQEDASEAFNAAGYA